MFNGHICSNIVIFSYLNDIERTGWRGGFMSLLFRGRIVVSWGSDKVPSAIETGDISVRNRPGPVRKSSP